MSNEKLLAALFGEAGADANLTLRACAPDSIIDGTPILHWAVSAGNIDAVSTLLAMGADPNRQTASGVSALISAAYAGESKIIELLLQAGADIDGVDADGQGPLMASAKGGHFGIVRTLIDAGADVARVDARKRSVLHWAVIEADNDEIVQYLLKHGASKQAISTDGFSARDYAVKLGRPRSAAHL